MHGQKPPDGPDLGDLDALEGVNKFPVRVKCALLAWTTLEEALSGGGPKAKGISA
jgi:nitrogen fixation NifU-like protein